MMGKECCEKLKPYAGLFLRLGLGIIFTYHGFGKVFGAGTSMGTAWNPGLPVPVQALVAWGEFLGGVAILLGFMTELAAFASSLSCSARSLRSTLKTVLACKTVDLNTIS